MWLWRWGTDFSGEEFTIAGGVAVCGGATARCHRVQHIASKLTDWPPYYTKQSRRTKNMGFCECFVLFMYVLLMFFLVFIWRCFVLLFLFYFFFARIAAVVAAASDAATTQFSFSSPVSFVRCAFIQRCRRLHLLRFCRLFVGVVG